MKRLLMVLLSLPIISTAQISFEKNLGDTSYQDGRGVVQTADGGFLISGRAVDASGYYDILLMKTDSLGNLIWTKTWGSTASDFAESIRPTADGGFIMSATTYSFSSQPGTNSDWWIFRFDANGDTLWTRIVNNLGNDRMYDAIETSDGSFLGCGWISSGGYARGTIRKFSSTGALLHTFSLGSGANSYAQSVKELPNGNYMLVGSRLQTTFGADLVQLDTTLNYINDYFFNLPLTGENAQTLERLPQGGYMLAVKTGYILDRFDIWLLRLNDQFDTMWTQTITQRPVKINQSEEPFGFTAVADSGYLLCGQKLIGTSMRAVVYRLDTSGNVMWIRDFGGSPNGDNKFWQPLALPDGGFVFTGGYVDSLTYDVNVYLVRTDGQGMVNTITTGIQQMPELAFSLFPNPVIDRLNWLGVAPGATIELYTMTGQLVYSEKVISSSGTLAYGKLVPGIYACLIRENGKVRVEKIIVA